MIKYDDLGGYMINLSNNIYNFTQPIGLMNDTCLLNQYALIEQTNKLPQKLFYLSLIVMIALLIQIYIIPLLFKWKYYHYIESAGVGLAIPFSVFLSLGLWYFTFQLSTTQIKTIEHYMYWIAGALFMFALYRLYITYRGGKIEIT